MDNVSSRINGTKCITRNGPQWTSMWMLLPTHIQGAGETRVCTFGAIKYELNNYEYTMDSLITKFGEGMMDYYKSDRKKLGVEIKKLMKSQYGSIKEGKDNIDDTLRYGIVQSLCSEGGIFLRNVNKLFKSSKFKTIDMVKYPKKSILDMIEYLGEDEIDTSDMWADHYKAYRS